MRTSINLALTAGSITAQEEAYVEDFWKVCLE